MAAKQKRRPLYETAGDLSNELRLIHAHFPEYQAFKLPRSYQMDFALLENGAKKGKHPIQRFIEVRKRKIASDKYDTFMCSAAKYERACNMKVRYNVPVHILVEWTDIVGLADLTEPSMDYGFPVNGREDRNDPADVEPVALFNIKDKFEVIHTYE